VETRPASSGSQYTTRDGRRDDGTYEVQPNDNYWLISEKLYGTGAYFKALAEHNRRKSARDERLQVGDVIVTPDVAQLEKSYPDLCPKPSRREAAKRQMTTVSARQTTGGRTYVTQEGDTLYDIARTELGKAARWAEIYELNRDLLGSDYHYLRPGLQLALPEGDAAAQLGKVTRRAEPDAAFRR
jgi:nucleoid-associated protein YgaU